MDAPLITDDFKEFLRLLNANRVDYLLVGGYAVGLHGYPRATVDRDIWVSPTDDNAPRVIETLAAFGFDSPALEPVVKPELGEGPHLSYAVQWFIFTVCAAVGWVLAIRHSAAQRHRQAELAAEPAPAEAA